jgi:uncharacterized protein (DUF1778 family)
MARQDKSHLIETRISMRIDPARKEIISRAARIRHTTLSAFMIENAYGAANELLADQTQIVMSVKEIDHFFNVLDKPPQKNINALVKLLSTKSVLDE